MFMSKQDDQNVSLNSFSDRSALNNLFALFFFAFFTKWKFSPNFQPQHESEKKYL